MGNLWFRLYHEWDSDPKVQSMPEVMQRRLVMLFCSRCREERISDPDRAFHWRISPAELQETKLLFISKGFIDENWNIVNWNRRQFLSDSSTDRVRRHRENRGLKQDETLQKQDVTFPNVSLKQGVTAPDTDTDTDTDTETEQKKPSAKAKPVADPRHSEFKKAFGNYYSLVNRVDAPWDGKEASALSRFLKANPAVGLEQWRQILNNRRRSPVSQTAPLSRWIGNAFAWFSGLADEWGKPIGANGHAKSNGNGKQDYLLAYLKDLDEEPEAGAGEHGDAARGQARTRAN